MKFFRVIGIGFLISIPIIFCLFLSADDHGLFLPRTDLIDQIIPEFFIYIQSDYEYRCSEELVFVFSIIYFLFLAVMNFFFWKNDHKKSLRIIHCIFTIGLVLIGFLTMVEDDIFHELKIRDPIGRQGYENKVTVFYGFLLFWIMMQLFYWFALIADKLEIKR